MSSSTVSHKAAISADADNLAAEAARYALLRRIAPAIRHHMAGTLQPIGMISAILERRLQAPTPDMAVLRDSCKSISALSRTAAGASMNLISWVAPRENGIVLLEAGVEECVGMLSTDLAFRGFTLANRVAAADVNVSQVALRTVFTASLIALTDAAPAPASVLVTSDLTGDTARVCISVAAQEGASTAQDPRSYRDLGWDDVQALASAEQVSISHSANKVELGFLVLENSDLTV
ncbi:MAG: hypothetical protein Q8K71_01855 [Polaromonas sp.]|uniref:hypothetical protein n=1 Tax=Polaromonas sp. TaxID=1869339 RepID=UPI00272FD229|nr:hypothetical protein [Polaromonas sp.]MDP1740158.1 hypothetical protein [Polaromonas sp.]MDP1953200.1 hypothetical protein [Polaromonas sp.]MDP3752672.1 hypothetical protein [Polaromonas sp.]